MSFSDSSPFGRGQNGFALAVLCSAAATALGVACLFLLDGGRASVALIAFLLALVSATIVIGLAAALIGLPVTWILAGNRLERAWTYPLAGFLAGGAMVVLAELAAGLDRGQVGIFPDALIGALPGCLCGALWWWFERRHAQRELQADQGTGYG